MNFDAIHMNPSGRYLQACVWFSFLYGKDPEKIKYVAKLKKEQALFLRKIAKQAVTGFKQTGKSDAK